MKEAYPQRLEECRNYSDIFGLVKEGVNETLGKSRAGLMLGLSNLGGSSSFYIGAYYPVASNIIVMNVFPLKRILETKPEILKPYIFHILLHEYLHSLDYLDEAKVRGLTYEICLKLFGREHLASRLSHDIRPFLPQLSYASFGWFPDKEPEIYVVEDFDRGSITYIS